MFPFSSHQAYKSDEFYVKKLLPPAETCATSMSLNCLVSAQVGMRPSPGHLLQKNNTSQPAEPAQVAVSIDSSSFPTPSMLFITGHAVTKFPLPILWTLSDLFVTLTSLVSSVYPV